MNERTKSNILRRRNTLFQQMTYTEIKTVVEKHTLVLVD